MSNFKFTGEKSWIDENQELIAFLKSAAWSGFAQNMVTAIDKYGHLTKRQEAASRSMMAKCKKKAEARKANATGTKLVGSIAELPLMKAFDKARESGLIRPRISMYGIVISPAGASSKNAGYLYVKNNGLYKGKISPQGTYYPSGGSLNNNPNTLRLVAEMITDPLKASKAFGIETGNCCLCNRTLTNPDSIAKGIGPICESRWF